MKAKEIVAVNPTSIHEVANIGNTLQELQSFLLSFIDVHKGEKVEIHLHFSAGANTNNINIYGSDNSINLKDSM